MCTTFCWTNIYQIEHFGFYIFIKQKKKTAKKKLITCENFKSNHFVIKTKTFEIKSIQFALCASGFIFSWYAIHLYPKPIQWTNFIFIVNYCNFFFIFDAPCTLYIFTRRIRATIALLKHLWQHISTPNWFIFSKIIGAKI